MVLQCSSWLCILYLSPYGINNSSIMSKTNILSTPEHIYTVCKYTPEHTYTLTTEHIYTLTTVCVSTQCKHWH